MSFICGDELLVSAGADAACRVVPVLKSQIKDGKIDLKAIINTHQYVPFYMAMAVDCK